MRKFIGASVAVVILAVLIGVAVAQMRGGPWRGMHGGMGPGLMMGSGFGTARHAGDRGEGQGVSAALCRSIPGRLQGRAGSSIDRNASRHVRG